MPMNVLQTTLCYELCAARVKNILFCVITVNPFITNSNQIFNSNLKILLKS